MAIRQEQLEVFRQRLLSERERLRAELRQIEAGTWRASLVETEVSGYDDHPADLASETFEREKAPALVENIRGLLSRVGVALEKIERCTYGICDRCGQPINPTRLEALPFAILCLPCQSRLEGLDLKARPEG